MLFLLFKKLLANFGFQLAKEEGGLESYLDRQGSVRAFCILTEGSIDWHITAEKSRDYIEAYNNDPYFQEPPEQIDPVRENFDSFRFKVPLVNYDEILIVMYFLQSGFVDGFLIDDESFAYPEVIIREHDVVGEVAEKPASAIADFLAALSEHPDLAILHNYIGKLYVEKGEIDKAATAFVNATEKLPFYAEPYSNMGALVWNTESKEKGFKLFCEAFLRNPFDVTLQDNFIKAGIDLNAADEMNNLIFKAQEYYPDYTGMLYVKALLLEKLGQIEECKDVLKDYLSKNPDDAAALKLLEDVKVAAVKKQVSLEKK